MTRIFLYEHLTAGGWSQDASSDSLLREGAAMLNAVAEDFLRADVEVDVILEERSLPLFTAGIATASNPQLNVHTAQIPSERDVLFDTLAASACWSLVIAPETGGVLRELNERVRRAGGRVLGVNRKLGEVASSKNATAEFLAQHQIRTPAGIVIAMNGPSDNADAVARLANSALPCPAVLKPDDGCGSQGVARISNRAELLALIQLAAGNPHTPLRLEEEIPGIAASVCVILGARHEVLLPACYQRLGGTSGFEYQHSQIIEDAALAARAAKLARQVVAAIRTLDGDEPSLGWLGIDLVLAADPPEEPSVVKNQSANFTLSGDAVIEINPRLTTSYVALQAANLREHYPENLAAAMLTAAAGLCNSDRALA